MFGNAAKSRLLSRCDRPYRPSPARLKRRPAEALEGSQCGRGRFLFQRGGPGGTLALVLIAGLAFSRLESGLDGEHLSTWDRIWWATTTVTTVRRPLPANRYRPRSRDRGDGARHRLCRHAHGRRRRVFRADGPSAGWGAASRTHGRSRTESGASTSGSNGSRTPCGSWRTRFEAAQAEVLEPGPGRLNLTKRPGRSDLSGDRATQDASAHSLIQSLWLEGGS
jgi:hypothetical protein